MPDHNLDSRKGLMLAQLEAMRELTRELRAIREIMERAERQRRQQPALME